MLQFLSYEANPTSQQFLHHALLEGAGLVTAGFEGGDLSVHVGEDSGDGGLFVSDGRQTSMLSALEARISFRWPPWFQFAQPLHLQKVGRGSTNRNGSRKRFFVAQDSWRHATGYLIGTAKPEVVECFDSA